MYGLPHLFELGDDFASSNPVDLIRRSWVRLPPRSKDFFFVTIYTSELILCSTICVPSATRHNIHMYPYFLFAAIHHLKSSPTFSVRPCSSVGRVTVDLIRRSWVRFPPRSKDFFFVTIYTSELILCSTICVPSATRHNIHMYPYFLFAAIHHLKSSPTFSVRPCSSVGRVTVDLIRRSWVRFPPRSKDFFFASCGSLFPFTRANAQWVIHGFQ